MMESHERELIRKQIQNLSESEKIDFYERHKKNEVLPVVLSLLLPGLGQIVLGDVGMGVVMIVLTIVGGILSLILIGLLVLPVVWIWSMVDAYNRAKKYNAMLYRLIFEG